MSTPLRFGLYLGVVLFVVGGAWYWYEDRVSADNLPSVPVYGIYASSTETIVSESLVVKHIPTPDPLKAVYMTSWVASTPSLRERVIRLINNTEINAVVIDVKDDTGRIVFTTDNKLLNTIGSPEDRIRDLPELIDRLHEHDIYVIARIAVFQDPYLAKARPDLAVQRAADSSVWKDRKGLSWVDPGSKEVWSYITTVAEETYALGFDEINFDYIRFPSDGDLRNLAYPHSNLASTTRAEVIKSFFANLHQTFAPRKITISGDIFGMTTTAVDDMNIGQILENALPYFDYVAPMVYPSHYPANFHGYPDPNKVPYEVVKYAMDEAVRRAKVASTSPSKIRPWIQDFDYPVLYTVAMVRDQQQAVYDAGLTSWMMWDPSNTYTKEAYSVASSTVR